MGSHPATYMADTEANVLLLLLACAPTATPAAGAPSFRDATDDQRDAAFAAALGVGTLTAWSALFAAQADALGGADPACPAVVVEGDTTTWTADGCVGPVSGRVWSGDARAVNTPGLADLLDASRTDPDRPYLVTLDAWTGAEAGGVTRLDGSFGMSDWGLGDAWSSDQDLRVELPGLPAFRTTAATDCVRRDDGGSACVPRGPQTGSVDGFGDLGVTADGVAVDGAGQLEGELTIVGPADTVRVDLAGLVYGCADGRLDDGSVIEVCLPEAVEPEGGAAPGSWSEGPILGLSGPMLDVDGLALSAFVATEVATMDVTVDAGAFGRGEETHPLVPGGWQEGFEAWRFDLAVPAGAYVPGVSTGLPPLDAAGLAVRLRAFDAGGTALGCAFTLPVDAEGAPQGTPDDWFDNAGCPVE